ncbi:MAG: riboflavin kinase [Pseudomonadales bacterium]|nr:riboflavin kinase [Pseudomonadales bacterium]
MAGADQEEKHVVWYSSHVFAGQKLGRTIGYPTLNLDAHSIPRSTKPGVYTSQLILEGQEYVGGLYYGPRYVLGETTQVLEVYVLDFDGEVYGKEVQFTIDRFIRPPKDVKTLDELKELLKADELAVRAGGRVG